MRLTALQKLIAQLCFRCYFDLMMYNKILAAVNEHINSVGILGDVANLTNLSRPRSKEQRLFVADTGSMANLRSGKQEPFRINAAQLLLLFGRKFICPGEIFHIRAVGVDLHQIDHEIRSEDDPVHEPGSVISGIIFQKFPEHEIVSLINSTIGDVCKDVLMLQDQFCNLLLPTFVGNGKIEEYQISRGIGFF